MAPPIEPDDDLLGGTTEVKRLMPRCFECGWDGPPLMSNEAEWMAAGHNLVVHGRVPKP